MSRTGPTGFDAWSSRGGRPERTLGERPHVLGARVVAWLAVPSITLQKSGVQEFRKLQAVWGLSLYEIILHRELF